MADEQQILPADLDRIETQARVVEDVFLSTYGSRMPAGRAALAALQSMIDDQVFHPNETYKLQSLGIALGRVLAEYPGLSWVTVSDQYGEDPALRYKQTSILVFPLTMISKRVEDGREVDVEYFYEATIAKIRESEYTAD